MTTLQLRNSINPLPWRYGFFLIALVCFGLSPAVRAVTPAPDGGYAGSNTAEGTSALFSRTTGIWNTADGYQTLYHDTSGNFNTAEGLRALFSNTTGANNTATGVYALYSNTTGANNTATGVLALFSNTTGGNNAASGYQALYRNTTGLRNTGFGAQAGFANSINTDNTAVGFQALVSNTGADNTAVGSQALLNNTGGFNTAIGRQALLNNTTGVANIALGSNAGIALTTGSDNIDIGNEGVFGESSTIRIGNDDDHFITFMAGIYGVTVSGGTAVYINSVGQLGTVSSSERFKKEIKPMDQTSEAILQLRPVTFHYKSDNTGTPQFGLIAEEVAKVNPDLVVRDKNGEIYTVRYDAVNAMLLNEFLKQHRKVEEQDATITQLKSTVAKQEATIAQQQKGMEVFTASLKEQASQIQKVSDQLELSKPAPRTVGNNQ